MKRREERELEFGRDDCEVLRKRWRTPLRSVNLGFWDCGAEKMISVSRGFSASTE
jgi:hypothetical protein